MMRKALNDYSLYVFDLDGTLYDQPKLRRIMAMRLMMYYAVHPHLAKELFLLSHFRKVKDKWTQSSSDEDVIRQVATDTGADADKVSGVVKKWIYDDPLTALRRTRDDSLFEWIGKLRAAGKKVVILSDYPTEDKMKALEIEADRQYGPDDDRIDELKPSPKGLMVIMEDFGADPGDVLMIGDRTEKDGKCAEAAGVDHLILARNIGKRGSYEV